MVRKQVVVLLHICPGPKPAVKILRPVVITVFLKRKIRMRSFFKEVNPMLNKMFGMRFRSFNRNEETSCKQDQKTI